MIITKVSTNDRTSESSGGHGCSRAGKDDFSPEIVRDNYQLAFEYLDHIFCNEMTYKMRQTWNLENAYGILVNFYAELIAKLPYDNLNRFKRLKLNHSNTFPPTYENRKQLFWIIEYESRNADE